MAIIATVWKRGLVLVVFAVALAACGPRIDQSGGPAPVDSHGKPLLDDGDGSYIAEPTPEPEWSIALRRQERIKELRRELADLEREEASARK